MKITRTFPLVGLCVMAACSSTPDGPSNASEPGTTGGAAGVGSGGGVSGASGSGGTTVDGGGAGTASGAGGSPQVDGGTTPATEAGGPGSAPVTLSGNPFAGAAMFVNPDWVTEIETSVSADAADATLLKSVETYSTAIWIDTIAKVPTIGKYLDLALAQQSKAGAPVITTFVIYDLPDRDCAASASNGELAIANNGEALYRSEYIDAIAAVLKAHPSQRIAAVVEPDSLPNLATNESIAKCANADPVYRRSVAYAISTLSLPNVALYLDAAHAGWLGWDANRAAAAAIYKDVLTTAGGVDKIRGFASDVANYNAMTGGDGATLEPTDPCPDELTYVQKMTVSLAAVGITNTSFVVDTSRSGKSDLRSKWGEWCNLKAAGLGERPVANPVAGVDAYLWVKPPGESDGTSDATATRYDPMCGGADATLNAPQAGTWFSDYFVSLAKNAVPSL